MKLTDMNQDDLVFIRCNGEDRGVDTVSAAIAMAREYKDTKVFTAVETSRGPVTEYDVKTAILDMDTIYRYLHPDEDISLNTEACKRIAYNINTELLGSNTFYRPGTEIDVDSVFVRDSQLNTKRRSLIRLYNRIVVAGGIPEDVVDELISILEPLDK